MSSRAPSATAHSRYTPSATPTRRRHQNGVKRTPQLHALDAEWDRAQRRPANLKRARSWPELVDDDRAAQALATAVSIVDDLDGLVAATNRVPTASLPSVADPDEVLGALVVAARHDDLAARVVLQRILPAVIAAAQRYRRKSFNEDYTDLAIGAAWLAIRSYNVEQRRRHVAASLVSDVMWIAFRRPARRKSVREIPTPNGVFMRTAAIPDALDPICALAGTVRAAAAAGIDGDHLELIRELARAGSPGAAARRHGVTSRTIRNRRDRATSSIRAALGPDWTDWDDQLTAAA